MSTPADIARDALNKYGAGRFARATYGKPGAVACVWSGGRIAGERNDCTVRALATAHPSMDYAEAHAHMAEHGRVNGRGSYRSNTVAAMRAAGGVPVYGCEGTLHQFARKFPRGVFVVLVSGHALAMIDGRQVDNGTNGIRRRVLLAFKFSD